LHYEGKDMLTATLTWVLPTTRKDGSALAPTDIAKVSVLSSANPSAPTDLPPDAVTFTTGDISATPGEVDFTVTVTDTQGNVSTGVTASVIVPPVTLASPSPVTNLVAVLNPAT
jgi:hypothetical protein